MRQQNSSRYSQHQRDGTIRVEANVRRKDAKGNPNQERANDSHELVEFVAGGTRVVMFRRQYGG
jgi:hypothetical protein